MERGVARQLSGLFQEWRRIMAPLLAESVVQRARVALGRSPIYSLRGLCLEHDGQRVVLSGKVSSYYHKQVAQQVVRVIADRKIALINSVRVEEENRQRAR